jgi:hypothetical protein
MPDMRSTLIALAGSLVLVASAMMISPADVEAKGKWPKVWTGTDKNWTSKPFKIKNRPGTDLQYNYVVFTAKKKPGTNKCVAKFGLRDKGVLKLSQEITTSSRRPKVVTGAWVFDPPDWATQLKGRVGVKTNGKCVWSLALLGPRKGQPPEQ